ncbi:MAG: IS110 family transposase [Acidobacteriia bacterium]|nr:IS110 family transposase [Terriglobia bacterium]
MPFRRLCHRTNSGHLLSARRHHVQTKTFSHVAAVVLSPGAGAERSRSRYWGDGDLCRGSRGSRHTAGPSFTRELEQLADWLKQCGIESVVMESTGFFWIPLFQILEDRGFRVCLVNARHVKNVPGRKTDVADCQWLQYLHSAGLLRASHRPPQVICALRSLWRHRESLVQMAAVHIQHVQKALDQMNIQLHHVIGDITGTTGLAIVEAILAGERDPKRLARLRDPRIVASEAKVAEALIGDYSPEHLFALRQSLQAYRQYQGWIWESAVSRLRFGKQRLLWNIQYGDFGARSHALCRTYYCGIEGALRVEIGRCGNA